MKKIYIIICLFLINIFIFSDTTQATKDEFFNDYFGTFNNAITTLTKDYSTISGLYNSTGFVKGSASIGSFPSFRVSANLGVIFFQNPLNFLKKVSFAKVDWSGIKKDLPAGLKEPLLWMDNNFIPVPVTNYTIGIGLPYGMEVGTKFNIAPIGSFIKQVTASSPDVTKNIGDILFWGVGVSFDYTILKEYKYFPSISVGTGFDYSDVSISFQKIPVGNVNLDPSNDSIPANIGFNTHNYNMGFFFEFTISKKFIFFEPFVNLKFIQTFNYSLTKINLELDFTNATQSAKDAYQGGNFEINNLDSNKNGVITPVTDFVVATGFEFVMSIYRMGIEGGFGLVSQKGYVTLDIKFQVEKSDFDKLKKAKK
ncbi:MAG: hypothetical protein A2086_12375 [Spirochaetes bacterium GWD1_27_9]|nr:MAG: hypothetical protein A2Z98_11300 [Spirochaetes bacterium GWB1_27_13]OHD35612.1 MAG: hypothetical protein A2086_12375 [Spirochaetes bacterium GWD1_27_9]